MLEHILEFSNVRGPPAGVKSLCQHPAVYQVECSWSQSIPALIITKGCVQIPSLFRILLDSFIIFIFIFVVVFIVVIFILWLFKTDVDTHDLNSTD